MSTSVPTNSSSTESTPDSSSTPVADVPDVSVVIPTHNRQDALDVAVRSVLAQTGVTVEVCVVDDGSTPAATVTPDPRVRLIRHDTPTGVATARSDGVDAANGRWIAFLDDDDLWAPTKLARQLEAAREVEAMWSYTGVIAVDPDFKILNGEPKPEATVEAILLRNAIPAGASNVVVRADLLTKASEGRETTFDPTLRHMADWDLWIRLAEAGGAPAVVHEPLVAYVQHGNNASLDTHDIEPEISVIERRFGRSVDHTYVHRWIGWSHMRSGDRLAAATSYLRAVQAGDRKSLIRAATAVVNPTWATGRLTTDPAWRAQADTWLKTFRPRPTPAANPTVSAAVGQAVGADAKPVLDTISIIIPTLGRPLLENLLTSIADGSHWPKTLVVSQQGVEQDPKRWVADLRARGMNVIHLINDEIGVAAGRNRGIEAIDTKYFCLTDDDCRVKADWLFEMNRMLTEHDGKVITGRVEPEEGHDVPSTITATEAFEITEPVMGNDPLFGNNMGMPQSAVDRIGYFNEEPFVRYSEDCDFAHRLLTSGIAIRYEPSPTVTHAHWRDESGLALTYARYAYCIGGMYGLHSRTGDTHMIKRAAYDLIRTPWWLLKGRLTNNEELSLVGRQYARHLAPGIVAGLRGDPTRVNLP